ncbi:MAG: hypothetical protein H7329_06845 [Opitutaceae bacterium]|nr:hypothetical protein [Cytophagales bacterium]
MPVNNISASISSADFETLLNEVNAIESKMNFLVSVTAKDKRAKQLMGAGSIGYVQYGLSTAKNNQDMLARNFSVEEYEKDVVLVTQLQQLNGKLGPLTQKIKDTLAVLGQELMGQTNEVYNVVKREAKNNGKLKQVADEMGARYEKSVDEVLPAQAAVTASLN